jgi:hypothetical protein
MAKEIDYIFMITLFVAGIILIVLSSSAFKTIKSTCKFNIIRSGMTSIMTIGSIFVTIPLTYLICSSQMNCKNSKTPGSRLGIYMLVVSLFSLTIITLSSMMIKNINKNIDSCGGNKMKQSIMILLVLNCIILIGTLLGIGLLYKDFILA